MQYIKNLKNKILVTKYHTYRRRAEKYNTDFNPTHPIPVPTLKVVQSMPITDEFWDGGLISHPDEAWACDPPTRSGIQAYLINRACEEELSRVAREVRQMTKWAIEYQGRINELAVKLGG